MKRLDEKLRIAKIILEKLRDGSMRWTPLMKVVVKESPSQWKAQVILKWLLEKGYVIRQERGVYQITENGRELLKTI